ncbi:hypothetical protein OVA29_03330 [Exiguobacterium sp. SL14]|nr:hypothetical protein [Exiguobacterium sp. SL14]MCY1689964.1 hypothetical protein [Exiguobacterium sp. SL14]
MGDVLFGPFLRKGSYSRVQVLDHVQADERFGQLYQEAQQLTEVDELMLYRRYLQKGERILFHGTFDPALFNLLSDEGYDLYLIELEATRTKQIAEKYQHKIYGWSHDVTDVVGPEYFDRIIFWERRFYVIRAGSCCCFSETSVNCYDRADACSCPCITSIT